MATIEENKNVEEGLFDKFKKNKKNQSSKGKKVWYLVDGRNDRKVAGPYDSFDDANAVWSVEANLSRTNAIRLQPRPFYEDLEDLDENKSYKGLTKKVYEAKETCSQDYLRYKKQLQNCKTIDELRKVWNEFRKDYDSEMTPNEEKALGELYKDLKKELTEGWVQFKFEDGSNPYVAKTKEEQDKMLKKYDNRLKQLSDTTYLVKKEKKLKEDKQVTYVWKKDGDDHILTKKGNDKALITLSRMNSGFPWTIYKGNKEITLDNDSDKLADIKAYILKNVDKILGKKLKESNDDLVIDPLDDYLSDLEKLFNDKIMISYSKLIDYVEQADIYDEDEIFLTTKKIDKTTELTIINMLKQYFSEKNIPIAISVENYNGGKRFIILVNANKYDKNFLKDFEYKGNWYNAKKDESLEEAKGKLDDALPELKELINEHKNSIIEYGEALKQGNVKNPNYKDYTTRFVFDVYYFLKGRGFNIYKYIDENDLRDDYLKTLMKKALSDCGIKTTLDEDLDTFNDKMDFLAKDEDEAIDGYKKVIKTIDNKNVKTQLGKIEKEEKAHKDYLEKVKKDKNVKYTEPLMDEE